MPDPGPSIFVTRRIPPEAVALLAATCAMAQWDHDEPVPDEVLAQAVAGVDGLYCLLTDRIDAALLDRAPRLRVVSQMAVGFDNIDVAACTARGIPVGNTPGVLTETTADLTWALLLATARRIVAAANAVQAGEWTTWSPMWMTGNDVHGKTLGIIGLGRIGLAVARRAQGFGLRVLYHSHAPAPEAAGVGAVFVDRETLLAESDFVSLHCPLTPETRGLVDEAFLRAMKPSAILINTTRGPVVNEDALVRALSEGWIHAAGLDVTVTEPIPMDSPLLRLPNCLILPHIGSASVETRTRMATMAAENLLAGLRGDLPPHCVNCDALGSRH
jgi:lactate dehydrogenase-like 2-hydroxyacid dehydrogenase